jgi:hypothetical protein
LSLHPPNFLPPHFFCRLPGPWSAGHFLQPHQSPTFKRKKVYKKVDKVKDRENRGPVEVVEKYVEETTDPMDAQSGNLEDWTKS